MPQVSVIIPSYNHAEFVESAVKSVLSQTLQDFEILVTDDGSTDGSPDIVKGIGDPRIDLMRFSENRGSCVATNECLRRATGEYVAMLSSDDEFLPEKLEKQVNFLNEHPKIAAVFCPPLFVDEEGSPLNNPHKDENVFSTENRNRFAWLNHFFRWGNALFHPGSLIRRSVFEEVGAYDTRLASVPDLDMWIRLCLSHEIHIMDETLAKFRILPEGRNESSATSRNFKRLYWETSIILEHYLKPEYLAAFNDIFPELVENGTLSYEQKIERLSVEAIRNGSPAHNAFALRALHSLPEIADKGRGPLLHTLSAEVDTAPSSVSPIMQFFWSSDGIFTAGNSRSIDYHTDIPQVVRHTFSMKGEHCRIRIDPDRRPTMIRLERIVVRQIGCDQELLRIDDKSGFPPLFETIGLVTVGEHPLDFLSLNSDPQFFLPPLQIKRNAIIDVEVTLRSCTNFAPLANELEIAKIENLRIPELERQLEESASMLEKEISEHKTTADSLEQETAEHEVTASMLSSETTLRQSTSFELLKSQNKVIRMQQAISWKITAPLRFLRRHLLDRFRTTKKDFSFDPKTYLELNPDLKEKFGDDLLAAKAHFHAHGKDEGRPFNLEEGPPPHLRTYKEWVRRYDNLEGTSVERLRKRGRDLKHKPLLSVIMPVFDPPERYLRQAIESVLGQAYEKWELCIVDDASLKSYVRSVLEEYAERDSRIKIAFRKTNGHISVTSNKALGLANGEFVAFLDHDDELRSHSLLRLAEKINEDPEVRFLYTDEDKIDAKGRRSDPYFKPDWNPDLLLSQNYLCHLSCCERKLVEEVGGFRKGFEGSQDWDLFLRVTERIKPSQIVHLPEVLYHWRSCSTSTAKSVNRKGYALEAARKTLESALERRNISASLKLANNKNNYWRVCYKLPEKLPLVSILIPTRDRVDLLRQCINSLFERTCYENFEIIILDNDSSDPNTKNYFHEISARENVRVLPVPGSFNYSHINNEGVRKANGKILVLLNNDIEVTHENWLNEMVSHVLRPEIGCVGAKLLYPDKTIQHGGVILGLGGVAGHAFKHYPSNHSGYKHRLQLIQNYEAVTAACIVLRKEVFDAVNGFDDKKLKVAFNDIDLCMKVVQSGYRNLWTPYAIMVHHESASRGAEKTLTQKKRFQKEMLHMQNKWGDTLKYDRSYNPNLTLDSEDFSLSFPPNSTTKQKKFR